MKDTNKINKEKLAERLKNLKGNMKSLNNQSINLITSQQFKLIVDLENWTEQHHYGIEPEQVESVKEGMKKRQKLLNFIYNKLK